MNKNLLIIGSVWPEPKSSAAGSRMMQLISIFKSQNYEITFATTCTKSDNAFNLSSIGVSENEIELNHSSFDNFVSLLNPSIVLFDRFMTEEQFGWRITENCPSALRILDTEDLHCLRKGRYLAFKDKKPFDISYLFNDTAKREIASIYRSDLTLIISEVEMDFLQNEFKVDKSLLYYLPFLLGEITDQEVENLPDYSARKHFITIGNFLHPPNFDSIQYLKSSIWPIIKKSLPKSEMHVYGAYASEKVKQLHNEKDAFLIKGFAKDVNNIMKHAKICLAPLRFGAGLKGKLIDAMKNGTPCVTTKIGAEGLYGKLKPNALIEDTPEQIAEAAVELYTNKVLWKEKQLCGFNIINNRFYKSIFEAKFINQINHMQITINDHRLHNFTGQLLQHHTAQSTKYMSKWIEEKHKN